MHQWLTPYFNGCSVLSIIAKTPLSRCLNKKYYTLIFGECSYIFVREVLTELNFCPSQFEHFQLAILEPNVTSWIRECECLSVWTLAAEPCVIGFGQPGVSIARFTASHDNLTKSVAENLSVTDQRLQGFFQHSKPTVAMCRLPKSANIQHDLLQILRVTSRTFPALRLLPNGSPFRDRRIHDIDLRHDFLLAFLPVSAAFFALPFWRGSFCSFF